MCTTAAASEEREVRDVGHLMRHDLLVSIETRRAHDAEVPLLLQRPNEQLDPPARKELRVVVDTKDVVRSLLEVRAEHRLVLAPRGLPSLRVGGRDAHDEPRRRSERVAAASMRGEHLREACAEQRLRLLLAAAELLHQRVVVVEDD